MTRHAICPARIWQVDDDEAVTLEECLSAPGHDGPHSNGDGCCWGENGPSACGTEDFPVWADGSQDRMVCEQPAGHSGAHVGDDGDWSWVADGAFADLALARPKPRSA